jgi:hypothetical protein
MASKTVTVAHPDQHYATEKQKADAFEAAGIPKGTPFASYVNESGVSTEFKFVVEDEPEKASAKSKSG